MSRFAAVLVAVASLVASSCSDGEAGREWTDPTQFADPIVANATELVATDDYQLLLGDDSSDPTVGTVRCVQLVVGDVAIGCIGVDEDDGLPTGWADAVRVDDVRLIWSANPAAEESGQVVDHFVVWSSVDTNGRRLEAIQEFGTTHLIWAMRPG